MKAVRFETEGIFNSFRVPLFRTYHRSFLAPPKTTILGMIANIMAKPENWFYSVMDKNLIDVSVVIKKIGGKAKDLWAYKTFESKGGMHGRSVVRRDRLYNACYTIYLLIKDVDLNKEVLAALKCPQNIPSLGLDDELIKISGVEDVEMSINCSGKINSVFMDKGIKYAVRMTDSIEAVELPTANMVPLKFTTLERKTGEREARKPLEEYKQVEYINCEVKLEGTESFTDGINRVVFY